MSTANSQFWKCVHCGEDCYHSSQHFCRQLQSPRDHGAKEARQLTETDVRRIVREELAALSHPQPANTVNEQGIER